MKRIACFVFALLMLTSCFVACDKSNTQGATNSGNVDITINNTEELPNIPLTANYGGYEFNILSAGNAVHNDFDFEEETASPLDSALYNRKIKVEEDYKIKIVPTMQKGYSSASSGAVGPGFTAVNTQVTSGTNIYDFCIIAGYDVPVLAYSSMLYDMASIKQIGLDKSWWDKNATESLSMQDVVFFTTGDITISDNKVAFSMLFNKRLHENYDLESPYDMVKGGTWTIENFARLAKSVSEDLNNDGKYTEEDRYGLLVWDDSILGIVNAAGQRCGRINEKQEIELSFYNENTISALEQYAEIAYNEQYALQYQRTSLNGATLMQSDHGLFYTCTVGSIPALREMDSDFGVLPYPKLNVEQENYYSTVAPFNANFVCVPIVQDDINRTGTIMEALAYYGQKIVTPALYDITLVGQGTRDAESEPMLEIIFDNLVYDIGYFYQLGTINKELIYALRDRSSAFASMYDKKAPAAENALKSINQQYTKAVQLWKNLK